MRNRVVDPPNLVAHDFGRRVPHPEILSKLRVEGLQKGLIEVRDRRDCRILTVNGGKTHPAAKGLSVDALQRGNRPLEMTRQIQLPHVVGMADIVEELLEKRDPQVVLRLLQIERFLVVTPVPEHPGGKEAVEGGLYQARSEEPVAFGVIDVER